MQVMERTIKNDKNHVTNQIKETNLEFKKQLQSQIDELKTFVNNISNNAKAHREQLQESYNEKLSKIKDVCAQYFSKYEKHLLHQAELVKALEERQ